MPSRSEGWGGLFKVPRSGSLQIFAPSALLMSAYSYRSASIGLIRDAFTAGYAPNRTPTVTGTPKATTTDAVVTIVFHSAVCAINHARKKPNATPSTPPPTEIRIDSVRN